jgi:hypothetical protein
MRGTLQNALSTLPTKLIELQSNIKMFNLYVVQQLFGLTARGASVPELLNQLFNAYRIASDIRFVQAINSQHAAYIAGAPMDPDTLMTTALTLYEFYMDDKTWTPPAKTSKKIIAMQAKLDLMKDDSSGEATPQKKSKRDDAWKKEKPKNNEKTKVMNGRKINWCKWHKAWVIHDPSSCLLQTKKKAPQPSNDTKENEKPDIKPKSLKVKPALKAVIEDESDEEEYDE